MYKLSVSIFPGNRRSYLGNSINRRSYLGNSIFDGKNLDDWNPVFVKLKKILKQKNIEINTYDIPAKKPPFRYLHFDLPYLWEPGNFPVLKLILSHKDKNILFCNETPLVIPYNYMKIFHTFFTKIYTWNDEWVDNKKYFKINLPKNSSGLNTAAKKFENKDFLVLINSNKSAFLPFKIISPIGKELYSERIKAIEFFEKKIPDRFSLYGRGWNKPKKYNIKEAIFGYKKYLSYKGEIKVWGKIEQLSRFKYCICFENITNVKGYITEKIFDCFKAKCVPIYWGATNIEKYVPRGCFIDFRDFGGDYDKLLDFLNSIDETRYNQYIKNIEKLLSNKKFVDLWFEEGFARFFLEDILEIKSEKS